MTTVSSSGRGGRSGHGGLVRLYLRISSFLGLAWILAIVSAIFDSIASHEDGVVVCRTMENVLHGRTCEYWQAGCCRRMGTLGRSIYIHTHSYRLNRYR